MWVLRVCGVGLIRVYRLEFRAKGVNPKGQRLQLSEKGLWFMV